MTVEQKWLKTLAQEERTFTSDYSSSTRSGSFPACGICRGSCRESNAVQPDERLQLAFPSLQELMQFRVELHQGIAWWACHHSHGREGLQEEAGTRDPRQNTTPQWESKLTQLLPTASTQDLCSLEGEKAQRCPRGAAARSATSWQTPSKSITEGSVKLGSEGSPTEMVETIWLRICSDSVLGSPRPPSAWWFPRKTRDSEKLLHFQSRVGPSELLSTGSWFVREKVYRDKSAEGRGARVKSSGNHSWETSCPLPKESHRQGLILPETMCDDTGKVLPPGEAHPSLGGQIFYWRSCRHSASMWLTSAN